MVGYPYFKVIVSILILLEMSLEVGGYPIEGYYVISFNPYFVGDESGRIFLAYIKFFKILFQSLFCWR